MVKAAQRSRVEALLKTLEEPRGRKIATQHLQHYKKVAVLAVENGHSLNAICRALAVHRTTVFRWREDDADFDEAFTRARNIGDGVRLMLVEDRFYKDLIHGRAAPVERIYFLGNRSSGRWQDVRRIDHDFTGEGEALIPLALVRKAVAEAEALEVAGVTPISKAKRRKKKSG